MMPPVQELIEQFARVLGTEAPVPTPQPAPTALLAAPPSAPDGGRFQVYDFASRGWHLDVRLQPEEAPAAAAVLDRGGFALDTVTGVDWIAENQMEVVYDFFHPEGNLRIALRTRIPRDHPELPTISTVFPGANWHERETHDFFGIRFLGHPDLSPFLLPEDATYHPLRKDFVA